MTTIREQIIQRILTQLETISTANGYENTIGLGNVYRQEAVIKQANPPAAAVWELEEERKRNAYGGTVRVLKVRIEAIVSAPVDKHPAMVSNALLGDIEKALIIADVSLDILIDDIQDVAAEIAHFPQNKGLAGAAIDFEIKYTTEWGDPYSQGYSS
ncbi:hypothetical protein [Beggiatoa leptomitoformis]|uniref:Uncharacterized protein n=1 Tax=Beggiatoa leptomitoformis TaxID=288004 RepID=A0A2N9YGU2_9GAMM|nr:hypothetical protein [Beggiatoa leptomitoformis]ALG68087.1 hypothetical protein AL038_10690 [Beggiatoa leptomitoformis]AUI69619.1 hypothetical protein BLE401_13580 [Beggiatoa leptomitoformis]